MDQRTDVFYAIWNALFDCLPVFFDRWRIWNTKVVLWNFLMKIYFNESPWHGLTL